ncbi:MAG: NADH-quinone oxidoreductase subunit C [Bacteroidota bacterium]|nr:NADH-quinone oxidoreductase subunit C [Bacteroidota bacterium]
MNKEELTLYLETNFPELEKGDTGDFPMMWVNKDNLLAVATELNENPDTQFNFLFCETAVDWLTHFEVIYHLSSTKYNHDVVLKVKMEDRDHAELPSVFSLWKAADLYESEIYDMFGIRFSNHPHLRRIFLTDEWHGYPLRKDYKDENTFSL